MQKNKSVNICTSNVKTLDFVAVQRIYLNITKLTLRRAYHPSIYHCVILTNISFISCSLGIHHTTNYFNSYASSFYKISVLNGKRK
jgi:hypothetical protein